MRHGMRSHGFMYPFPSRLPAGPSKSLSLHTSAWGVGPSSSFLKKKYAMPGADSSSRRWFPSYILNHRRPLKKNHNTNMRNSKLIGNDTRAILPQKSLENAFTDFIRTGAFVPI